MRFKEYKNHNGNTDKIKIINEKIDIEKSGNDDSSKNEEAYKNENSSQNNGVVTKQLKQKSKINNNLISSDDEETLFGKNINDSTIEYCLDEFTIDKIKNKLDDDTYHLIKVSIKSDDKQIIKFIKFCIKKNIFDDTYYDYNNIYSIIATKLPKSFKKFSGKTENITKLKFINNLKKLKFNGNINYIFDTFEKNDNNEIIWDSYKSFFLPYVKNIII